MTRRQSEAQSVTSFSAAGGFLQAVGLMVLVGFVNYKVPSNVSVSIFSLLSILIVTKSQGLRPGPFFGFLAGVVPLLRKFSGRDWEGLVQLGGGSNHCPDRAFRFGRMGEGQTERGAGASAEGRAAHSTGAR
jgi:hypothetical protein